MNIVTRFVSWLRGPDVMPRPATEPVSEWRGGIAPIEVPAEGDVFAFTVFYETVWSARGLSQQTLSARVDEYVGSASRSVRNIVWPIGRQFLPHQPDAAEQAMNAQLNDGWCHDRNGEVVSCRAAVRVVADQRVTANLAPLWQRIAELDLRRRLERQRIDHVDDLLTGWLALIDKFGQDLRTAHAARLVEIPFADVVRDLARDDRNSRLELTTVLREASAAHEHVGLFEFAKAYDAAFRHFELQLGLRPGEAAVNSADMKGEG